ncbi:MAG TPA: hypothetical protein PLX45_13280 [Piscinibacter sp.]|nr:hypothetical protein [Piscinibacter sp.]HOY36108.1 hypothetical protein [Piscinibacter sp.]HPM67225.1 hypothetical protein [Piscinibacter sp.]
MRRFGTFFGVLATACLVAACGGGGGDAAGPADPPQAARPAGTALLGPAGGTVDGQDGARVDVPAGALPAEVSVTIAKDASGAPPVPRGFTPLSDIFAVTPHGARLAEPVTVSVPFDPAALGAGRKPALLKVTPGRPWQLIEAVTVQGNLASAQVRGFSYFLAVSVPESGWFDVNPPVPPPVTQPAFTMGLLPNGWVNLPITGSNARLVQQPAPEQDATVRIEVALPLQSDWGDTCWNGDLQVQVVRHSTGIYRLPSDPPAGTNRIAFDPETRQVIATFRPSDTRQSGQYALNATFDVWNPRPPATGLAALLGQAADIPANAIVDGVGAQLTLEVACMGEGSGFYFWVPQAVWTEEIPAPPIVVTRGFETPDLAVTQQPVSQSVYSGQWIQQEAWARSTTSGRALSASWQRAAPNSNVWVDLPVMVGSGDVPPGALYQYPAASAGNQVRTGFAGYTDAARDHGTRLRVRFCLAATTTPPAQPQYCVNSREAALGVSTQYPPPRITTPPRSQTFPAGQTLALDVAYTGYPLPSTVTWQTRTADDQPWVDVDAAVWLNQLRPGTVPDPLWIGAYVDGNDRLVSTRPLTVADRGRQFRATYTTIGGTATSDGATINVTTGLTPPSITVQPQDLGVGGGQTAVFTALADGAGPLSYQWLFNGSRLAGANAPTLTLGQVNAGNAGLYELEVSNAEDTVKSRAARLTVATGTVTPPPLGIVTNPAAQTVQAGGNAAFAVVATGGAPIAYRWERNGQPVPNANGAVLSLVGVSAAQAGDYVAVVSNDNGTVRSLPARLTVQDPQPVVQPPVIVTPPVGLTVNQGQRAVLAVGVSGGGNLAFQWSRGGSVLPGATAAVLVIDAASGSDAGNYSVTVSNEAGNATSPAAGLVVVPPPGAPVIVMPPVSMGVPEGFTAGFSAQVSGDPAPACQWTRNGIAIAGATSCTGYATPATTLADNGAVYNLIAYNPGGVAIGTGAVLTVSAAPMAPVITQDLADASAPEGGTAAFSVTATANGPINHYWVLGGAPTVEQGGSTFNVGPLQASDTGRFVRVIVCNGLLAQGLCTTSRDAFITVTPAVPPGALTATQLVAGYEWSMVLRPDRTVWAWGGLHKVDGTVVVSNLAGADQARRPVRMYPGVLTDVRQIAGWYDGFWAVTGEPGSAASRVLHWGNARSGNDGRGADGQGNLGVLPQFRVNATPVPMLERRSVNGTLQAAPVDRVCSIAATSDRVLLIRAQDAAGNPTSCAAGVAKTVWVAGTLTQFAANAVGVVVPVAGLPDGIPAQVIAAQQTAQSSAGPVMVRLEDGRLFGWGTNIGNLFGLPAPATQGYVGSNVAPQALPAAWGAASDAAFGYVSLFVTRADGSVMVSGRNDGGELGVGPQASGTVNNGPVALLASAGVAFDGVQALVSSQVQVSLALRQGRIHVWGAANQPLQGGSPARIDYAQQLPASGDGWRALSAGNAHAMAIAANGAVYTWGNGLRGALGNGVDNGSVLAPNLVTVP